MNILNMHRFIGIVYVISYTSVPYTQSEISAKLPFVFVIPFTLLIEGITFFVAQLFLFYIVHYF